MIVAQHPYLSIWYDTVAGSYLIHNDDTHDIDAQLMFTDDLRGACHFYNPLPTDVASACYRFCLTPMGERGIETDAPYIHKTGADIDTAVERK